MDYLERELKVLKDARKEILHRAKTAGDQGVNVGSSAITKSSSHLYRTALKYTQLIEKFEKKRHKLHAK